MTLNGSPPRKKDTGFYPCVPRRAGLLTLEFGNPMKCIYVLFTYLDIVVLYLFIPKHIFISLHTMSAMLLYIHFYPLKTYSDHRGYILASPFLRYGY